MRRSSALVGSGFGSFDSDMHIRVSDASPCHPPVKSTESNFPESGDASMSVLAREDRRSGAACPPLLTAVVQALPQPTIIVSSDLRVLAVNSAVHDIQPAIRT